MSTRNVNDQSLESGIAKREAEFRRTTENYFEKAVHEYVHMSPAHAAEFGYEFVDYDFENKREQIGLIENPDKFILRRIILTD